MGLKAVVTRWWSAIDAAATDAIIHAVGRRRVSMQAFETITPADTLGCGSWGCVWPTDADPRFVVKVTVDPTEGPIVALLMSDPELRAHPGIVYYLAAWRLPERPVYRGKPLDVYVIVREDASPVSWPGLWAKGPVGEALNDIENILMHRRRVWRPRPDGPQAIQFDTVLDISRAFWKADRALAAKGPGRGVGKRWEEAEDRWLAVLEELSGMRYAEDVGDFVLRLYERHKVILADVHTRNLGWRLHDLSDVDPTTAGGPTGRLTILDPGHSSVPVELGLPALPGPRANPPWSHVEELPW